MSRQLLHRLAANAPPSRFNLLADCALLALASVVATTKAPWSATLVTALVAIVTWLAGSRVLRHYDVRRAQQGLGGDLVLASVLVLATTAAIAVLGLAFPSLHAGLVRFAVVLWPPVIWLRVIIPGLRADSAPVEDEVLILGTGSLGRHTAIALAEARRPRAVLGYLALPGDGAPHHLRRPVLGASEHLERILCERAISEVYIAGNPLREGPAMQAAVGVCESFGVPFALPASDFRLGRARPAHPEAIPDGYVHYLTVQRRPVQMALKRAFDIAASSAALAVLVPIFLAVAGLIKTTSRGPVLFKQERVGRYGRPFYMLKFRSMVENAEALRAELSARNEQTGPVFKMKADPRITRVGRWLRKLSVDELPQLINVLRGEMSIVGPRPPLPSEVARYQGWHRRRLSVRPGITCLWQVSGRNEIGFEQWMYLDMRYIDHWSLREDFRLILKTVPVVIGGRGAS